MSQVNLFLSVCGYVLYCSYCNYVSFLYVCMYCSYIGSSIRDERLLPPDQRLTYKSNLIPYFGLADQREQLLQFYKTAIMFYVAR